MLSDISRVADDVADGGGAGGVVAGGCGARVFFGLGFSFGLDPLAALLEEAEEGGEEEPGRSMSRAGGGCGRSITSIFEGGEGEDSEEEAEEVECSSGGAVGSATVLCLFPN